MQVIFYDNHILVVSKPAGMATQPHPGSATNLTDLAKAFVKEKYSKPGRVFLEPVHRLDKPVSGLVLFARTDKALSRLQEQMRQRQIQKTYFARVEGTPPEDAGMLEHYLVHDEHKARVVQPSHPEGKPARLQYRVVKRIEGGCLLEINLETGRYHQIRVQFAAVGCPIVGDVKYGSKHALPEAQILLHSGKLQFVHPVTKLLVSFNSSSDASDGYSAISSLSRHPI